MADVSPDNYLPAVWSLDTGNVQGIQTSRTDPNVTLDSKGLYVVDENGTTQVLITGDGTAPGEPTTGVLLDKNGLRLPSRNGLFSIFSRTQQVRWELPGGVSVASIDSLYDSSPLVGEKMTLTATSPSAAPGSINLTATDPARSVSVRLLDSTGASEFPRFRGPGKYQMIAANIRSDGLILFQTGGITSVAVPTAGQYTITFTDTCAQQALQYTPGSGTGAFNAEINGGSTTTISYFSFNQAGTPVSSDHHLLIVRQLA